MTKSKLEKEEFISDYNFGNEVYHAEEGMAADHWSKKLRDHIFNHIQKKKVDSK